MADLPYSIIDGHYRVRRVLGDGPYATVYEAIDPDGETVAVKVFDPRVRHDPMFTSFFRRDARAVTALSHANIVPVETYGVSHGSHYMVMPVIHGPSFAESTLSLIPAFTAGLGNSIARVLDILHRADIVHGGIRPTNLFLIAGGEVAVTPAGGRHSVIDTVASNAEQLVVTYMSPEQISGRSVGATSDIYSLGIVLYEMATGTLPFSGVTPADQAAERLARIPEALRLRRPTIPAELDEAVLSCLDPAPGDRPSAAELASQLAALSPASRSIPDETQISPMRVRW